LPFSFLFYDVLHKLKIQGKWFGNCIMHREAS
jgi:hypothetical protein